MCSSPQEDICEGKNNSMIQTAEKFANDQTVAIECKFELDAVVGFGRPSFLILVLKSAFFSTFFGIWA